MKTIYTKVNRKKTDKTVEIVILENQGITSKEIDRIRGYGNMKKELTKLSKLHLL